MPNPNWTKGISGNPRGRPKKERALTSILERGGSAMIEIDGERISGRRLMARQVWEGITTGEVSFPGNKKLTLSPQDWKDFVKWAYAHIDGPPVTQVSLETEGEIVIRYADNDNPADPAPEAITS